MGINDLDNVVNEADVQDRYRVAFRNVFSDIIFESRYNTDGIAYSAKNKLRMIIEQKHEYDFTNLKDRAKVVAQIIKYLKVIHDNDATKMPKVAVVGDENETFVIPVINIINYISIKDYKWHLPASSMYKDEVLMNDLIGDDVIKTLYIFDPKKEFREIIIKIKDINKGINVPRTLTEKNIEKVFEYFCKKITIKLGIKKIAPNDMVNLFAHIMLHPETVVLSGDKLFTTMFKETLNIGNVNNYKGFVQEFSRVYTPKQKHIFTAILDRLIEDTTRRSQGEFFTPYKWTNKAHEYIASVYGENWKEEYVVWDPAWGTGNLTRDYKFGELYVSTLNQSDIDTANQMGYNPEAVKFPYDFLNDDYSGLPNSLRKAIEEGRKIIVLMNPPYGTSTDIRNISSNDTKHKEGITNTKIAEQMRQEGFGKGSEQLYTQFFYRLTKMGVDNICMFSTPIFLSSDTFGKFRENVLSLYDFQGGFLMDSKNFADVKSWGLSFSIFKKK